MFLKFRSSTTKKTYNAEKIQKFLEEFTLEPCNRYPFFKENNCTNFISQVVYEGGISKIYGPWDNSSSWFCSTNSHKELEKISLSWRTARGFRAHFKSNNRCSYYEEVTLRKFLDNYNYYCSFLSVGSIIQYINLSKGTFPYHSQVIYNINKNSKNKDIFICQNTRDLFNYSLLEYLNQLDSNKDYIICLYKFD